MFAAVRASRAMKRSSGRRKGRLKLLRCSTFAGGLSDNRVILHTVVSNPSIQKSSSLDNDYTQIAPYNSNTRAGGRAATYLFQFTLEGLPLTITPGTGILIPDGMLKFISTPGSTYSRAWHNMPSTLVQYYYRVWRNGRFRRTYRDYIYFQWRLYCVSGSTVKEAKYRLVPEHTGLTGSRSFHARYIAASLGRFRNYVKTGSDDLLTRVLGSYTNRGYSAYSQGSNVWLLGQYNVGQGYRNFYPYGYQLNLEMIGAPGNFLEWRRQ